ncbi:MAG: hypothetical protein KDB21_02630 [Acidimicrobiales bacterium]|nr:hypothetical protein [Acidimicrobiales bacterium]
MLDSVRLERLGIPTVTIVTEPFVAAALAVARAQGLPDLPLVVVPHDYLPETIAEIRAKVEPVADAVAARLLLSAAG